MEPVNQQKMKSARPVLAADQGTGETTPEETTQPADPVIAEQVGQVLRDRAAQRYRSQGPTPALNLAIQADTSRPAIDPQTTDAPLPAHLWPCGCLPNTVAQHGGGCPGTTVARRVMPGELEEIQHRARRGQMIHPAEALALVRTVQSLVRRVTTRYEEAAQALQRAADAEQAMTESTLLERAERAERQVAEVGRELDGYRRSHVCTDRCRPNAHIGFEARQRVVGLEQGLERAREVIEQRDAAINELADTVAGLRAERERDTQQLAEVRKRFNIDASADLYQALSSQVGDLQTSEAELVSAPLQAQVRQLERQLAYREHQIRALHDDRERVERETQQRVTKLQAENAGLLARSEALAEEVGRVRGRQATAEQRAVQLARQADETEIRRRTEEQRAEQLAAELKVAQDQAAEDKRAMDRLDTMTYQRQETVYGQQLSTGGQILDQVRQLVTAEGVDRAAEDLPEVDQDQASAEEAAGYYLARVIQQVRDAVGVREPVAADRPGHLHHPTEYTQSDSARQEPREE